MGNEEQFAVVIDTIADKLGIAATEIFNIFVGAQMMLGVLAILECIVIFLLCVGTYFLAMKVISGFWTFKHALAGLEASDRYTNSDDKNFILVVPIFAALCSIMIWGITVNTIKYAIIKISCPEYSAIHEIIELII